MYVNQNISVNQVNSGTGTTGVLPAIYRSEGRTDGKRTIFSDKYENFLLKVHNVIQEELHPPVQHGFFHRPSPRFHAASVVVIPTHGYGRGGGGVGGRQVVNQTVINQVQQNQTINVHGNNNGNIAATNSPVSNISNQNQNVVANTQVNGHGRKKNEGESDTATRVAVGAGATAVGAIALFVLGIFINKKEETDQEMKDVKDLRKSIKNLASGPFGHEHIDKLDHVTNTVKDIVKSKQHRNIFTLSIIVTFVAAAALALIGAFTGIVPLMLAGAAVGVVALGALCFKLGYDLFDKSYAKRLREIEPDVNALLNAQYQIPVYR